MWHELKNYLQKHVKPTNKEVVLLLYICIAKMEKLNGKLELLNLPVLFWKLVEIQIWSTYIMKCLREIVFGKDYWNKSCSNCPILAELGHFNRDYYKLHQQSWPARWNRLEVSYTFLLKFQLGLIPVEAIVVSQKTITHPAYFNIKT